MTIATTKSVESAYALAADRLSSAADDRAALLSEIRDLNDALTARELELAQYRQAPFVPAADHNRVQERLSAALECIDAMTAQIANMQDGRNKRLASERLSIMEAVAPFAGRVAHGHGEERDAFRALFAHVAEHGRRVDLDEARAAFEEWEARR